MHNSFSFRQSELNITLDRTLMVNKQKHVLSYCCDVDYSVSLSSKMQKLVKAAKEGTKDRLEKTKAAVKRGRSFMKTKSFCQGMLILIEPDSSKIYVNKISSCFYVLERKSACFEDESEVFIEVDCFNVEPVLSPTPEGLTQQQVRTFHRSLLSCKSMKPYQILTLQYFPSAACAKMYIGLYFRK